MPESRNTSAAFESAKAQDGIALEPQLAAHADEMFTVLRDPAIYQYENEPPPSLEWLRQRFARLESRRSADGQQQWLNWVVRLPSAELIGYAQARSLRLLERLGFELATAEMHTALEAASDEILMVRDVHRR